MNAINDQLTRHALYLQVKRLRKMLAKAKTRTSCQDAHRSFGKIGDALDWIERYADLADWREVEAEILRVDDAMATLSADIRFIDSPSKRNNARDYHDRAKIAVESIRRVVFVETLTL
jgi:hypothetical protein